MWMCWHAVAYCSSFLSAILQLLEPYELVIVRLVYGASAAGLCSRSVAVEHSYAVHPLQWHCPFCHLHVTSGSSFILNSICQFPQWHSGWLSDIFSHRWPQTNLPQAEFPKTVNKGGKLFYFTSAKVTVQLELKEKNIFWPKAFIWGFRQYIPLWCLLSMKKSRM